MLFRSRRSVTAAQSNEVRWKDGVAPIGCDGMGGTYYQLYTDERGVQPVWKTDREVRPA